jgi:hypothetical protein
MCGGRIVANNIDAAMLGPECSLDPLYHLRNEFGPKRMIQEQHYVARRYRQRQREWVSALARQLSRRCVQQAWQDLATTRRREYPEMETRTPREAAGLCRSLNRQRCISQGAATPSMLRAAHSVAILHRKPHGPERVHGQAIDPQKRSRSHLCDESDRMGGPHPTRCHTVVSRRLYS